VFWSRSASPLVLLAAATREDSPRPQSLTRPNFRIDNRMSLPVETARAAEQVEGADTINTFPAGGKPVESASEIETHAR